MKFDVVIIGAGMAGIATAFYLCKKSERCSVLLIDSRQPMSYTSAQSGDNYRNWWPHTTMAAFTNDSIDELDRLAHDSDDVFRMTRGGYVLATRRGDVSTLLAAIASDIDVEVIDDSNTLRGRYAALGDEIKSVVHIRRGGDFSGQQLGQYMLEKIREAGGSRVTGDVIAIEKGEHYSIEVAGSSRRISADIVVNAAGPFVNRIAEMLGVELPITNIYQQKIAFEDRLGAIPRAMPFSIDLDVKILGWSDEERELLIEDDALAWLTNELPGGVHCRPEGGTHSRWVKLGWAYNEAPSDPQEDLANEPAIDPQFPEIVIRGAAAFIPSLHPYVEVPPARFSHYGGYYTMTAENWPLIGPLDGDGAFVAGALSGFGSMSACAAGKLCANHVCGEVLPDYATSLSLARYDDTELMTRLLAADKGLL